MGIFDRFFGGKSKSEDGEEVREIVASLERTLDLEWQDVIYRLSSSSEIASPDDLPPAARVRFDVLQNLVVDEVAYEEESAVKVPFEELHKLDSADQSALGFTPQRGWNVDIRVGNIIGKGAPKVVLRWTDPDGTYRAVQDGKYLSVPCGFLRQSDKALHVLPRSWVELRDLIDNQDQKFADRADEFRFLAHIQEVVRDIREQGGNADMIQVQKQLQSEEYVAPNVISIDFRQNEDGSVDLRPALDGWDDFDSAEDLASAPRRKRIFKRERGGKTVRVALDEHVHREVERVRRRAHIPPEEVQDFVRDPRRFLQPPEELAAERESRAKELGVDVTELPDESEDTLQLNVVMERIGELELGDYGGRVKGFARQERELNRARRATKLEDWKGTPTHDPSARGQDTSSKVPEESTAAGPASTVLIPASNEEDLEYRRVAGQLNASFAALGSPILFDGTFYPHQGAGYAWLRNLFDGAEEAGGLLADDMGLGKTIQVIGLFAHLKEQGKLGPSLLVVPKSTIPNWKREIRKFCRQPIDVYEHLGAGRSKDPIELAERGVIVTTYDTLRSDQLLLGRVSFQLMICDEAQYIKNYTTGRSQACRSMDARMRISLTATPVENVLDELWSIVDFSQPGLLGTLRDFRQEFAEPIETGTQEASQQAAFALLKSMRGHYLRRTKQEHLKDSLPEKHIYRHKVEMQPLQLEWYEIVRKWYLRNRGWGNSMKAVRSLLRICSHPYSVPEDRIEEFGLEAPDWQDVLASPEALWTTSGKLLLIRGLLDDIQSRGEKAILFCTPKRMQQILQQCIRAEYGFSPVIINGDVSGNRRQDRIDVFNREGGFRVIIMSPLAAGIGVNVTGANHIVHVMREWNPAKENQATDRAYRIGQENDVHVHVPITSHPEWASLDERLDQLMEAKREIAEHVLRPAAGATIKAQELESVLDG